MLYADGTLPAANGGGLRWKSQGELLFSVRSETLMSGVMTLSFSHEDLGEHSVTTQDIIVSDMYVRSLLKTMI